MKKTSVSGRWGEKKFPALCNESVDCGRRGERSRRLVALFVHLPYCHSLDRNMVHHGRAAPVRNYCSLSWLASPRTSTAPPPPRYSGCSCPLQRRRRPIYFRTGGRCLFTRDVSHKRDRALNERNVRIPLLTVVRRQWRRSAFAGGENVLLQVAANEARRAFLCQKSD